MTLQLPRYETNVDDVDIEGEDDSPSPPPPAVLLFYVLHPS